MTKESLHLESGWVLGDFLFSLYFSAVIKFSTHYMHVCIYIYIYVYYNQKKFSKCYFH